ncbi:MAG: hypothetical protein COV74_10640 [Candidatus Omnitrophica bacterium CG11_big_fil_rev_8_21_14_0_20_45_26]|uniref:DUF3192 domain-containing protein n=1 Tax=Candidatus Abzuiibacterium crystallinum TaxID=1974748 RepID=A0A2H0LL15_9BACT|nr:MAG: hypothetical protein COV74_10640 [Candidatus Omnitrophica bacterium CG11_big_fil_rev_8_21_14_0_20_45_26]PIW63877.1 MAG: hypothetical protein COW12_08170 [Candidatus Omnitrophica bacterium CG12_big_fil_rev_8_21_14_0_65_45_16]
MKTFRRLTLLILFIVALAGCATLEDVRVENRESLENLNLGMTKDQAQQVMGTKTIRTYDAGYATPRSIINQPFRSEGFDIDDHFCEVLYYYTDLKAKDGAITDDELTPLVFVDNELIGWGRTFLDEAVAKHESDQQKEMN